MKTLALLTLALCPAFAHAEGLKVEDAKRPFVTKTISATKVKGVRVRITAEIERNDCNHRSVNGQMKLIDGTGEGFYDTYAGNLGILMTEMYCPLPKPIKETIASEPIDFKSFSNQYADGEVHLELVIPQGMDLKVEEIK